MNACTNPDVLKVIFFGKLLVNIVKTVVPIGLIVFGMFDFSKGLIGGEGGGKKGANILFFKRLLYAILIFLVPWIVEVVIVSLGDLADGVNITDCLQNANNNYILERTNKIAEEYLAIAEEQRTAGAVIDAASAIENVTDSELRKQLQSRLEELKEQIEIENATADDSTPNVDSNPTPNPDSNPTIINGIQGKYYAPIQSNDTYTFNSKSSTGKCGVVYHDIAIREGVKVYAGMDGTATFRQTTSTAVVSGKTVLTSYGTHVRLTSGNTTIIYGHLSKFSDDIVTPNLQTCPKNGEDAPCGANRYQSTSVTIATKDVKKGDLIGYTGDTGNSSGPHLHVEIQTEKGCICDPYAAFGMREDACKK